MTNEIPMLLTPDEIQVIMRRRARDPDANMLADWLVGIMRHTGNRTILRACMLLDFQPSEGSNATIGVAHFPEDMKIDQAIELHIDALYAVCERAGWSADAVVDCVRREITRLDGVRN